jgi:hypothetical protein
MTQTGKDSVKAKADALLKNIAYPDFFKFDDNSKSVDDYHVNYQGLESESDFFAMIDKLKIAHQKTENLGKLLQPVNRKNFQVKINLFSEEFKF